MARPISDSEILYWLGAFVGFQAICMGSLVWAVEHMKSHINTSSPEADLVILVILTFCCANCLLIAVMLGVSNAVVLSPVASYYGPSKAENSHRIEVQDESQT